MNSRSPASGADGSSGTSESLARPRNLLMALAVVVALAVGSAVWLGGGSSSRPGSAAGPAGSPVPASPAATSPTVTWPAVTSFPAFGEVTVTAEFDVAGAGENVDSIAFWEAPDPADSLMFVTSKDAPLVEVWRHPFSSPGAGTALAHGCLAAASDSATNGVAVDQELDRLYVASNHSPNVCVFSLPDLVHRLTITSGATFGEEPNLALMDLPGGSKRLYVSNDEVVYVHDARTGEKLSQFTPVKGLETMWGDSFNRILYIPDENERTGVYAYKPDGSAYKRSGRRILGDGAVFDSDAEGIIEYTCPPTPTADNGEGLIVVSDQVDDSSTGNDYEVFDRETWRHLGTVKLLVPDGSEYVHNTDGIGSTEQASSEYPAGLLTAVQDDKSVAGVGWHRIFDAIAAKTGKPFGCGR